ncbi:MAG: hypothetical protein ACLQPD_35315 [Desulfomonilaceae bacterium]
MGKITKQLKGGYLGNQRLVVRFRVSAALHEKIRELARRQELCLAAAVRKLVVVGLEKPND